MGSSDVDRQRVFQLVHEDDAHGLAEELDRHQPEAWSAWRNIAGRTLYQAAERESRERCLELLRERLQAQGFVPRQVPRVDYFDTTSEVLDIVQEIVPVSVPEAHYHKTMRYVPKLSVTEVPEVIEVPRRTIREELQVREEHVRREKEVNQTTIREEVDVRRVLERREETTERPLPVDLAPVERIAETHVVDVRPDVRYSVPREADVVRDFEEVPFQHNVYVPMSEVKFVDQCQVRQREVTVSHVTEHPVIVEKHEVECKPVTLTDTEIIRNIKYVPQLPVQTEWVPPGRGRELGHSTTNASPGGDDLWYELNMLRSKNAHLARMNARLQGGLDLCGERARQLGDQLARERQLREDKERQARELESGMAKATHLNKLPPRILRSGSDCVLSPEQSTTFLSSILQESAISHRSPFVTPQRQSRVDRSLVY